MRRREEPDLGSGPHPAWAADEKGPLRHHVTMTHDYKRNGTATLYAALDAVQGQVISMCDNRHRHQESLKFLRAIDAVVPQVQQIHMIVDNYATHKHHRVQRWLDRHPRFRMHFTPLGCS
jgi:transposase